MSNWADSLHSEKGVAMTETVIAIPILILLSIGMAQLAFIFRAQIDLDYACFRAARRAIVSLENKKDWKVEAKKEAAAVLKPSMLKTISDPSIARSLDYLFTEQHITLTPINFSEKPQIGHPLQIKMTYDYRLPLPFGRLFAKPPEVSDDILPVPEPRLFAWQDHAERFLGEGFYRIPLQTQCALTIESGSYAKKNTLR